MNRIKKFNENYEYFNYYIILFLTMSISGWGMEFLYSLLFRNKVINPGFLFGPYCPIYGFGALILLLCLSRYKKNNKVLFLNSMIICSFFEYLTSVVIEIIFKKKIWDYSTAFLNVNGRVCLLASICWGILGVLFIKKIEPIIYKKYLKIKDSGINIFYYLLMIIFLFDTFFSILKHLIIFIK